MRFLRSDIKRFQMLYSQHFGKVISSEDATRELSLLVRQCELIYQPVTLAELDRLALKRYKKGRQ